MGAPVTSLLSQIKTTPSFAKKSLAVKLPQTCFFGNVMSFRAAVKEAEKMEDVEFDFSETVHVDHTFMHELIAVNCECEQQGCKICLKDFEKLVPVSEHEEASRRILVNGKA